MIDLSEILDTSENIGSVTIAKTTIYEDESDAEYDPSKRRKINNAWIWDFD